jgi:hypothetical protein
MAPDRPGYDTLGDPDSSQPLSGALTLVSVIKSMLKKDRALVELRDLQCTNETIQRSYVVPGSILKRLRI